MEYNPQNLEEHLLECMRNARLEHLFNCRDVRRVYEEKLIQANGELPSNYSMLSCSYTEPVLEMAREERRKIAERIAAARRAREEARRKQIQASNRFWTDMVNKGREQLGGFDLDRGPLVHAGDMGSVDTPKSQISGAKGSARADFHGFEQAGLMQAFYVGRFDVLEKKRRNIMFYINRVQETISDRVFIDLYKDACVQYINPSLQDSLLSYINSQMGLDNGGWNAPADAGLAIFASVLFDFADQGGSGLMRRTRNIDFLRSQAEKDTLLLASKFGCKSKTTESIFDGMERFVLRK